MLRSVRRSLARITTNMTFTSVDSTPLHSMLADNDFSDYDGGLGSVQGDRILVNKNGVLHVCSNVRECHLDFVVRD